MATRIKLRRDTAANWLDANPILANGETAVEIDTRRIKVGDGVTAWKTLEYAVTGRLHIDGETINTEQGVKFVTQDPETWIAKLMSPTLEGTPWQEGSTVNNVMYDSVGNVIVSGGFGGWNGPSDFRAFMAKFDAQGNLIWQRGFQTNVYSGGYGMVIDGDNNIVQLTIEWTSHAEIYVTKFDSDTGDSIWSTRLWDNTYNYDADGYNIDFTSDNNIIIQGTVSVGDQEGQWKPYVAKINKVNGSVIWQRTFGEYVIDQKATGMCVTSDDNIIISGHGIVLYNGNHTALIAKYNTDGDLQWIKRVYNDELWNDGLRLKGMDCVAGDNGEFFLTGGYEVRQVKAQVPYTDDFIEYAGFVAAFDMDGVVSWARQIGPNGFESIGNSITYNNGNVYVSVVSSRQKLTRNPYSDTTWDLIIASFNGDNGVVNYQNYFGPEAFYTGIGQNDNGGWNNDNPNGQLVAVSGEYLAVGGFASYIDGSEGGYSAPIAFVSQIPADGTTQDVSGWKIEPSNVKLEYAQFKSAGWDDFPSSMTWEPGTLSYDNSYSFELTDTNLKPTIVNAGANEWNFRADGDTVLPKDGNLAFGRAQKGTITELGDLDHSNLNNYWNGFSSVAMDADGNQYWVGYYDFYDNSQYGPRPTVVKINAQGGVEWQSELNNDYYNNWDGVAGYGQTIAIDPTTGNLVVVAVDGGEGNGDQMLIIGIDAKTGRKVVPEQRYWANNGHGAKSTLILDSAIDSTGNVYVAGRVYSDFVDTSISSVGPLSGISKLQIERTQFGANTAPNNIHSTSNWYVLGHGIGYEDAIYSNSVNEYYGITPSTREGSGANFDITANGAGAYTIVIGSSGGTNYCVGHKIKVLGTALGGVTPDNDAIVTVDTVDTGVITGVSISGTSTGSTTYNGVTGTNYQIGSGAVFDITIDDGDLTYGISQDAQGTNYAVGDVLTILGSQVGGVNGTNDITLTVTSVGLMDGSIDWGQYTTDAMPASDRYVMLNVDDNIDFSEYPNWTIRHYVGDDAMIMKLTSTFTPVWTKVLDNQGTDRATAIAVDRDDNVVFGGRIRLDGNEGSAFVAKVNGETGDLMWLKDVSPYGWTNWETQSLNVDSANNIVGSTQHYAYPYNNNPWIFKLNPDGDRLWQQRPGLDGNEGVSPTAVDDDDNIYAMYWSNNYPYNNRDHATVVKMASDGKFIWQREITQSNDNNMGFWVNKTHGGSRFLAANADHVTFGGWKDDLDGNEGNSFSVKLPVDGTAIGNFGDWKIAEQLNYYVNDDRITGDNSSIDGIGLRTIETQLDGSWNEVKIKQQFEPVTTTDLFSADGGHIKFSDGTTQDTSAQGLPQVPLRTGENYYITKADAGRHIYVTNYSNPTIYLRDFNSLDVPIGTEIHIINWTGGWVYLRPDDEKVIILGAGTNQYVAGYWPWTSWSFYDNGGGNWITLLKVEESDRNGSVWIVKGATNDLTYNS